MTIELFTPVLIGSKIPKGTSGSVLFVDSNIKLAQNNTNFFWNNSTNQLKVSSLDLKDGNITNVGDVSLDTISDDAGVENQLTIANLNTAYTHSQDNTQAHSDYLLNTGDISSGDYTFNGSVGVGITPTENFHTYNADGISAYFQSGKTSNAFKNGAKFDFDDTNNGTTGFNGLAISTAHSATGGTYGQNQTGVNSSFTLRGSATQMGTVTGYLSQVVLRQPTGDYNITNIFGGKFLVGSALDTSGFSPTVTNMSALVASAVDSWASTLATWNITNMTGIDIQTDMNDNGNGTVINITDLNGIYIRDPFRFGSSSGTQTNVTGIKIDKATVGTNKAGLWLNGDGAGSDVIIGAGRDAKIYYDGTDVIIDPNVVGTGKVLIGATANDTINAGSYEVGGVAGLTGVYTFGGGSTGDIASMTYTSGILTAVTTVP